MEAWNKGLSVGQKNPLNRSQVWEIRKKLEIAENWRDLCLFSVAIDTMLRASDLLALKVGDLLDENGEPKHQLSTRQQKTSKAVLVELSKYSGDCLKEWLKQSHKTRFDYIFTGLKSRTGRPIGRVQYSKLIKKWVKEIRLNPDNYSTHSLRRTLPALIYEETNNIEAVRQLLGQSSVTATSHYLNVGQKASLDIARKFRI